MSTLTDRSSDVVILGGGLAGLSAAYTLSNAGFPVTVYEQDNSVGGLSRTVVHQNFRFDLGGHRFFTKDKGTEDFVVALLDGELASVPRKSSIYLKGRYFDYPLKPANAVFGMGIPATLRILAEYTVELVKKSVSPPTIVSLEDWVVSQFGRTLFNIYFRDYSEKVWGINCRRISADWVEQRINGLSLMKAIQNAFFRVGGKSVPTLAGRFLYPRLGIGRIAERLREEIEKKNEVHTGTAVECVGHSNRVIENILVRSERDTQLIKAHEFVSSIPLPKLLKILDPAPPQAIVAAAESLRYRDLVVMAIMLNRDQITDETWIYLPDKGIPFGRIHEPKNWSRDMAPEGKTLLVIEYFSFEGDRIWAEKDENLTAITVQHLEKLGFIKQEDVMGSAVVRVPKAYPLFEIGYKETCEAIYAYLEGFRNLHIAGRTGMFRYYNIDHAIESGIETAQSIIRKRIIPEPSGMKDTVLPCKCI